VSGLALAAGFAENGYARLPVASAIRSEIGPLKSRNLDMNHRRIVLFSPQSCREVLSFGIVAILVFVFPFCSTLPAQPAVINKPDIIEYQPPVQWVTVSVKNQTGNSLKLQRVDFDEVKTVLQLGGAGNLKLRVASGYYVLSMLEKEKSVQGKRSGAIESRLRWPVPADARLTKSLEVTVSLQNVPENLREHWGFIPAGPAVVGDVIGLGRDEERPARIENVKPFLIGRYEVSNQQYADFLNEQEQIPEDWVDLKSRKCLIKRVDSPENNTSKTAESHPVFVTTSPIKPVVMVSREGARQYCAWLTRKTNVVHRLATEVEWEKAARGPESFLYAYGNICRISAANQESGHLRDSGQFAPNGFGLYDMTGNCFEWVSGEYATSTRLTGLLRGGSFIFDGIYNRTSFRMRQAPTVMTDDIGFRVVREIEAPPRIAD
jgi:formylglycine-generating enzyme required for sulfatase activity